MPETPEQKARREIDGDLLAAGWLVQSRDELDLTAGRGVAVREFQMKPGFGFADYLLYVNRKAIGAVEAKASGTLTGVEAQSAKYAAGLPDNLPAHRRPLPFLCNAYQYVLDRFERDLDRDEKRALQENLVEGMELSPKVGRMCAMSIRWCWPILPSGRNKVFFS